MCARTLRSSRWRTADELRLLTYLSRRIIAIQLQGHIFFGNATILAAEVERMIRQSIATGDVSFIVLDFTLVVGIDSSAAETILRIFKYCKKNHIRLCYSSGSVRGFPCVFPLSSSINALDQEEIMVVFNHCTHCGASYTDSSHACVSCGMGRNRLNRKKWVYHSHNLDDALAWCEDIIITEHRNTLKTSIHASDSHATTTIGNGSSNSDGGGGMSNTHILSDGKDTSSSIITNIASTNIPTYLHQINIMAGEYESPDKVDRLLSYFVRDSIDQGTVLWMQVWYGDFLADDDE